MLLLLLLLFAALLHVRLAPAFWFGQCEGIHEAAVHVTHNLTLELSGAGLNAQVAPPQLDDLAAAAARPHASN
jgi:hypothetical protein